MNPMYTMVVYNNKAYAVFDCNEAVEAYYALRPQDFEECEFWDEFTIVVGTLH